MEAAAARSPGRSITESTVYSRSRHTNLAGRSSIIWTCTGSGRTAFTSLCPRTQATLAQGSRDWLATAEPLSSRRSFGCYPGEDRQLIYVSKVYSNRSECKCDYGSL
jgi:hypothetical protein